MIGYKPKGVKKAVELLNKAVEPIYIYLDPDPDGVYSGILVMKFLNIFGKKYEYGINENREHGFKQKIDERWKGRTIVAVDFTITTEEMQELERVGATVINIDHHEIVEQKVFETEHGVIINNQYCFEPEAWRFLSGAGMVHAVFSEIYPDFDTEDNRAIVGLSLLSDIRVLESDEARMYLESTYRNKSPFFKHLIELTRNTKDFTFGDIYIDRSYADYVLHPKLNALFRMNMGIEAVHLLLQDDDTVKGIDLTYLKDQQNQIIDKILDNMQGDEYDNLIVKYVYSDLIPEGIYRYSITNFIGVACSRVRGSGKTTFLYVKDRKTDKCIRGSVRGCFDTVNYLNLFRENGVNCAGHHNAFGVISCDMNAIDFITMEHKLKELEINCLEEEYRNRIVRTTNFSVFTAMKNMNLATYNIYVRDSKRIYIQYLGDNWEKQQHGKMWEIKIDGITVKCFDAELTPNNAYILPILERGYIQYYLKKLAV